MPKATSNPATTDRGLQFAVRRKCFQIRLAADGALELWLDGCLRKRRALSERWPQYVWTNVELEWEEHHFVEARYDGPRERLSVTVNGQEVYDGPLLPDAGPSLAR